MESLVLKLVLITQLLSWLGLGLSQSPPELRLELDGCASISTMQLDSALPLPALCHTLQFANDHGCFCFPSSSSHKQMHKDLTFAATDVCGLYLWLPESPFCRSLSGKEVISKIFKSQMMFPKLNSLEEKKISVVSVTSSQNVAAAGGLLLVSCLLMCPCFRPKKRIVKHQTLAEKMSSFEVPTTLEPQGNSPVHSLSSHHSCGGGIVFSMARITKATRNFSPSLRIGQGGFGTVYKGFLEDGMEVAIKRAKKDAFKSRLTAEFRNEVAMLAKIEHQNLVKLIGYCEQEDEHILVTEYVTNGNLREHLDGQYETILDFPTRLEIAINVAHALTYLHMYADLPIIHRDVKSSNILLTDNFKAKVADFGFSRVGPIDANETHVSTGVKGTAGYLDPEYLKTYQLTPKSDVFSFGVLLVELLTGRRPIELKKDSEERITIRWAFKKADQGKVAELLDPAMARVPGSELLAEKIFNLAFDCAAPTRSDRPNMKEAQQQLWEIRSLYYQTLRSTENIT